MEILRKAASFGALKDDLEILYIAYVRSHLEQSAVVSDFERVVKSAVRIIIGGQYENYKKPCQY